MASNDEDDCKGLRRDVDRLMRIVFNGGEGHSLSERMLKIETMLGTIIKIAVGGIVAVPAIYALFRWLLSAAGVHLSSN